MKATPVSPEDDPEPAVVGAAQKLAQHVVQELCEMLARQGWDFVLVSIARRIDVSPDRSVAPGATGMQVDHTRMKEALDTNVSALRKMADDIEKMVDTSQAVELESYLHDQSHPSRGQWPR